MVSTGLAGEIFTFSGHLEPPPHPVEVFRGSLDLNDKWRDPIPPLGTSKNQFRWLFEVLCGTCLLG